MRQERGIIDEQAQLGQDVAMQAHKYRLLHAQRFLDALEEYTRKNPAPEAEDSPEYDAWQRGAVSAVMNALEEQDR